MADDLAEPNMNCTRRSLYYPIFYLLAGGLFMAAAPRLSLNLMFSNGDYGQVFPRFAGVLSIGLGLIVAQIVRHRVTALYTTLIAVRVFFCICYLILGLASHDPLFAALFVLVGLGAVMTSFAWTKDSRPRTRNQSA